MLRKPLPLLCGWLDLIDKTVMQIPSRIEVLFEPGKLIIGRRKEECQIILDSPIISAVHCAIWVDSTEESLFKVYIEDLSNQSGTYVNGQSICDPTPLQRNDIVALRIQVPHDQGGPAIRFKFRLFSPKSIYAQYDFGDELGRGTYGSVSKLRSRATGKVWAVKSIEYAYLSPSSSNDPVKREVDILRQLSHDNIVQFFKAFREPGYVFIIMEYVPGGSLKGLIKARQGLTECEAAQALQQICKGLQYLHSASVAHRDLKASNILVQSQKPLHVKICDFGVAKIMTENQPYFKSLVGTAQYMAPEVPDSEYDETVDVYSAGVIMFLMLSNQYPNDDNDDIVYARASGENHPHVVLWSRLPSGISNNAKRLLHKILKHPGERPPIPKILSSKWIREELSSV